MLYLFLIAGIALSLLLGLIALVAAIVLAIKKHWRTTLICAGIMILAVALALTCIGILAIEGAGALHHRVERFTRYNAERAQQEELRHAARVNAVKALNPSVLTTPINDEFWTYDGFRDWYRVPVRYPYSMESIDTLDAAALHVNHANGKCSDPNTQESGVLYRITYYSTDAAMLLYRRDDNDNVTWGIFVYDTALTTTFPTKDDMLKEAHARCFTGPETLESVKHHYDDYWGR
jgi:hypothetical protein